MNIKYHLSALSFSALALLFGFTSCVNDELEKSCSISGEAITFGIEAQVAPMQSPLGAPLTRAIEGSNRQPGVDDPNSILEGEEDENYVGRLLIRIYKKNGTQEKELSNVTLDQEFKEGKINYSPIDLTGKVSHDETLYIQLYANDYQDSKGGGPIPKNFANFSEGKVNKAKELYPVYKYAGDDGILTREELKTAVSDNKRGLPMVSPVYSFTLNKDLKGKTTLSEAYNTETDKVEPIQLVRTVARVRIAITNINPKTGKPYKGVETLSFAGLKGYGLNLKTSPLTEKLGTELETSKEDMKVSTGEETQGTVKYPVYVPDTKDPSKMVKKVDENSNTVYEYKHLKYPFSLKEPIHVTLVDLYVPDHSLEKLTTFSQDSYACYFLATLKGADPVGNLGNFEPGGEIGDTRAINADVTVGNSSDLLFKIYSNFNGTPNFAIVRNTFYDFTANIRGRNKSDFTLKLEVPDYVEETPVDIIIKDHQTTRTIK